jgi:alpha-amylase
MILKIWISPITFNMPERTAWGDPWHGYWQQDLYHLNENFGTVEDLKALSQALHDKKMVGDLSRGSLKL